MIRGPSLAIGLLSIFTFISCQGLRENKQTASDHYRLGTDLLYKKNYPQSLQHLKMADKLDSRNPFVLNNLGLVYYFMGELDESIYHLKKSISAKSNYSEARNNLGRVYIDAKNFEAARQQLKLALSDLTYPNRDKILVNLGLSYFLQDNQAMAEPFFLKAIAANRKNCLGYNYLGRSLIEIEQFKRAQKTLNQAILHCRESNFDEAHYFSAIALFRDGRKNHAISRLQEAQKLYPKGTYQRKIKTMLDLMSITEIQ